MRVLVTGGAGFIGSAVTTHLVRQGHQVTVADRFTYAGKARNLGPVLSKIGLLIGDLAQGDLAVRCAETAPEAIIHMAAETHVDRAIADPEAFVVSNTLGTTRLLQALYQYSAGVKKIVVYSTDEVYGPTPAGTVFDEQAPFRPSNAYSASKVGVEGIAHAFWVTHQMPVCIVRPCNTYGPGQHPEKAIPRFVGQMLRGEPVTLYNDGHGSRDWMHTTDHARAVETVMLAGTPGEAYNLAAGEEHTDRDIAERLQTILDVPATLTYVPGRPGHDRRYAMDGAKLRLLGWQPQVPFAQGLLQVVQWTVAHQDWWAQDAVTLEGAGV